MNFEQLEERIHEQCESVDAVAQCSQKLREGFSFRSVGGPFVDMNPAEVLKTIDPIQWQIYLNTHCQNHGLMKVGDKYYDTDDVQAAVEDYTLGLRYQLTVLSRSLNPPTDPNEKAIAVANLKEFISAVENYVPSKT